MSDEAEKPDETPPDPKALAVEDHLKLRRQENEHALMMETPGGGAFVLAQRQAQALANSSLLPDAYQGNIPNCLIAMEVAERIGAGVMQVCQNLHIVKNKPSWSASFLIATVNASGNWSPMEFRMEGQKGKMDWGCRAYATDLSSAKERRGPLVDMQMAKDEGWSTKSGSKWKTMPEVMLHYRAAAFWTRLYAPELAMGIQTREEVIDVGSSSVRADLPAALVPGDTKALETAILADGATVPDAVVVPTEGSEDDGEAEDDGRMSEEDEAAMVAEQEDRAREEQS